ncbi:MAG TPA: hypothetical protein VIM51_13445, partial [Desulfosporosinus sp.]
FVLSQDQTLHKKLFQLLIEEDDSLIVFVKLLRVSLIGCPCCLVFKDHDSNMMFEVSTAAIG